MTNDLGERRDLADERDSIEYQAMCDQVREEWSAWSVETGFAIDGAAVHREAMRRLREKYESACGKD